MIKDSDVAYVEGWLKHEFGYANASLVFDRPQLKLLHTLITELDDRRRLPGECLAPEKIDAIMSLTSPDVPSTHGIVVLSQGVRSLLDERQNLLRRFPLTGALTEQIACVMREIAIRERVYPSWVKSGKMTQETANIELARMKAVLNTLEKMKR